MSWDPTQVLSAFQPSRIDRSADEVDNPGRGLYEWSGQKFVVPDELISDQDAYKRFSWRELEPTQGTFYQLVDDEKRAWHAGAGPLPNDPGDVNDRSMGIEIVNEGNGRDPYTEAQYRALEQLIPHLPERHGIDPDHVVGHREVSERKQDPSDNFDFDRILRSLDP